MKRYYIGNRQNETVTTLCESPTDRQLRYALRRMQGTAFRYAPVGDHSVSEDDIYEYNDRLTA